MLGTETKFVFSITKEAIQLKLQKLQSSTNYMFGFYISVSYKMFSMQRCQREYTNPNLKHADQCPTKRQVNL